MVDVLSSLVSSPYGHSSFKTDIKFARIKLIICDVSDKCVWCVSHIPVVDSHRVYLIM